MSQNQPAQPTKRNLFKTALAVGAIGAIGGYFGGKKQGETAERTAESQHSPQAYPCYGEHQAGIVTPRQAFSIMCAFDVTAQSAKQLENLFRTLTARIEFLTQGGEYQDGDDKLPSAGSGILGKAFNPDGLTVTVGVGSSLFDGRFGLKDKKTVHLQEMRDFPNDKLQKSWCDGDLSLQICAFTPETCQAALRDIIKHTAQTAVIRWSIDGWQPKSEPGAMAARNLGLPRRHGQPQGFRSQNRRRGFMDGRGRQQPRRTGVGEKRQLSGSPPYPPLCRVLGQDAASRANRHFRAAKIQRGADGRQKRSRPTGFRQRPRG